MRRDMDLIRQILIDIVDDKFVLDDLDAVALYHLEMLIEKNFVLGVAVFQGWDGPSYSHKEDIRLTYNGHEFVETIRPQTVWEKIKSHLREKGVGLTIDSIAQSAPTIVSGLIS
jgi:Hypothetical protein (DUF2513)